MKVIRWLSVGIVLALLVGAVMMYFFSAITAFLSGIVVFNTFALMAFINRSLWDDNDSGKMENQKADADDEADEDN